MRLHCKQESWSQVCKDTRPNHKYIYKATQIWFFFLIKMRDVLGVMKKSSLRGDVESKPNFNF
jgi:hypothetical protein